MNLLTPENLVFLFTLTISLTIMFLLVTNAYFFRELHHLKVIFSYTPNTIKKTRSWIRNWITHWENVSQIR